jgi:hypothetical protein
MIEARKSLVIWSNPAGTGQMKGTAAEGSSVSWPEIAWAVGEYPPDCHFDEALSWFAYISAAAAVEPNVYHEPSEKCSWFIFYLKKIF